MRRVALTPAPRDQSGFLAWCQQTIAELCRSSQIDTREQMEQAKATFRIPVALTDAATIAIDWSVAENFTLTVSGSRTLGNPSNPEPGSWRTVNVKGNNASARTLSFGTQYGSGKPTLMDITASKNYLLEIYCVSETLFVVRATNSSA